MHSYKIPIAIGSFVLVFVGLVLFLSRVRFEFVVAMGGKEYVVEVADTEYLMEKGLSGHDPLEPGRGMLFIFDRAGLHGIWMKDMTFPIDIVWIDQNMKVVHLEQSVKPETYPTVFTPPLPSLYVLEVSAGEIEKLRVKIGDTIVFTKKKL